MDKQEQIEQAIRNKTSIKCLYHGFDRYISPHTIGYGKNGDIMTLVYQYDGQSSSGVVEQWKCMRVSDIENIEQINDKWHTGASHTQKQTCVKDIIIEVSYEKVA